MQEIESATVTNPNLWLKQIGWVLLFFVGYILVVGIVSHLAELQYIKLINIPENVYRDLTKNDSKYMVLNSLFEFVFTMAYIWAFWKYVLRQTWPQIGFIDQNALKNFFLGALTGIVTISLGFAFLYFTGHIHIVDITFNGSDFVYYFILFVIVAILEEVMTRGLMLNTLMQGMNKYLALVLVSFIFGAMHLMNDNVSVLSFLNVSLAGLFLGISYIYNKSLYFPIGLHLTWNFFQGAVYGFEVSGHNIHGIVDQSISGNELITGGLFGFEGSLIAMPIMLVAIWLIHSYYSTQSTEPQVIK